METRKKVLAIVDNLIKSIQNQITNKENELNDLEFDDYEFEAMKTIQQDIYKEAITQLEIALDWIWETRDEIDMELDNE